MASSPTSLIIGLGGHVVAIDFSTGTELWRTKLKGRDFVTVFTDGGRVFAGAQGLLFCLDRATGHILWENKLKGLGLGVIAFEGLSEIVAAAAANAAKKAAATAATT